ncbi:phosphatase PAP2 family protein [Nitratidesulfovibrio sp. SRB-5]|uniref:phosphatase PAP2 family protein n=1 Tax=Nitratidesulfovibrio sp. SRB-5 TaxID=2872636 RepID=UPI00102565EC|nr:phosphatase PAP2 family protein [Nitratidesulfovibrio sp. SRB-5]MBZ2170456.1 phosphatase PAP2 family protein [Nitratidesulfovibrio sp. SRB-5]RXF78224.1 phosphatase PAP2 family protein [Desulfovibrio sp. DS-1]
MAGHPAHHTLFPHTPMLHIFDTPFTWDIEWLLRVNVDWRNAALDLLMPLVSSTLLLWVAIAACGALYLARSGKAGLRPLLALLLVVGIAAGLADASSNVFKKATDRVRPLKALPMVHYRDGGEWRQNPTDFKQRKNKGDSFVSAHAANTMAVAVALYAMLPGLGAACAGRRRDDAPSGPSGPSGLSGTNAASPRPASRLLYLAFLLPLVVGYSRLYLGKHYPSDVLGGWLVGLLAGCAAVWAWRLATGQRRTA